MRPWLAVTVLTCLSVPSFASYDFIHNSRDVILKGIQAVRQPRFQEKYKEVTGRTITWRTFPQSDEECEGCQLFITAARGLLDLEWDEVYPILLTLCEEEVGGPGGFNTDLFCPGLMRIQGPTALDALRRSRNHSEHVSCQRLNFCFTPETTLDDDVLVRRKRSLQIRLQKIQKMRALVGQNLLPKLPGMKGLNTPREDVPKPKRTTFTIAQLSDIHISPDYSPGSPTQCNMYVCCYSYYNGTGSAGFYGDYNCNVPERTAKLFINHTLGLNPRPDFVLYSGDHPPHQMHNETWKFQMDSTRRLVAMLNETLPQNYKFYPVIGNHEMYPTNQFFMGINYTSEMTSEFAELWAHRAGFGEEQKATMNTAGYYSVLVSPRLRILAFNTNFGYTMNFYNLVNLDRPEYFQQQQFMRSILANATANNEKVIMLGHHPPGRHDSIYHWGRFYTGLVREYAETIVLQAYGHTHSDHFNIQMDAGRTRALGVSLISPSVSSSIGVNPSMRLFTLDSNTFEVLDYEQWFMDLRAHSGQDPPRIVRAYSAKREYNLRDLSPASWLDMARRMETDTELFNKFRRNLKAGGSMPACDTSCRIRHVCGLKTSSYDKHRECVALKQAQLTTAAPPSLSVTTTAPSAGTTCPTCPPCPSPSRPPCPNCHTRPPVSAGPTVLPSSVMLLIFAALALLC